MTTTYEEFLRGKVDFERFYGFDVTAEQVHPILKPHQSDIVRWAVKGGRRAVFAAFGMGKSIIQIGLSCGFSSGPHFSSAYRNFFGTTPREDRNQHRSGAAQEANAIGKHTEN